jgi:hypothetical protein
MGQTAYRARGMPPAGCQTGGPDGTQLPAPSHRCPARAHHQHLAATRRHVREQAVKGCELLSAAPEHHRHCLSMRPAPQLTHGRTGHFVLLGSPAGRLGCWLGSSQTRARPRRTDRCDMGNPPAPGGARSASGGEAWAVPDPEIRRSPRLALETQQLRQEAGRVGPVPWSSPGSSG